MAFAAFKSFKLCKGLYLEERVGARHYKARASVGGKPYTHNTETDDFHRAERDARSWFKRLIANGSNATGHHTVHEAAKAFLADLSGGKLRDYTAKWEGMSELWVGMDIEDITTPVLKDFIRRRKAKAAAKKPPVTLKPTTLHKDLVTLRRIIHFAVEEGWLASIPPFPKLDGRKANPRPWLEPDEWETLQRVAQKRIDEARDARTKRRRENMLDFCLLMVQTCTRVDELRALRVRDCSVRPPAKRVGEVTYLLTATGYAVEEPQSYFEARIKGKTGIRTTICGHAAVETFERLVKRNGLQPDDLLFPEGQRDAFRELLETAGLRTNRAGEPRNLKALRSTGLMLRVLKNPRINLKLLANSVGTSVQMLDQFYLKPLNVNMNVDELLR